MKSLLIVLLVVVAVVAVIFAVIMFLKARDLENQKRGSGQPNTPQDPFAASQDVAGNPLSIKAGDMLQFGNDKFFVRGTLRFTEGSYNWAEHFFQADAGATRQWLSVEQDPDIQMAIWRDRPDVRMAPTGNSIQLDNREYVFEERGQATFRSEGTTGLPLNGTVEYADYAASDGTMLSFERFGDGTWEASSGRPVPQGSFTIYPGS